MPTLYNYYDGSNYYLKLINKTIASNKQTSISLGDDATRIYTQSSGSISFTANLSIEENLTVGSSTSSKTLYVYSQIGVNTSSVYSNVTNQIKNSINNSVSTPPSFNNTDLLLLENATGSFLQLLSGSSTTSGIGFSTSSTRNIGSITYNYSTNVMSFTANTSTMTFNTSGTLTVPTINSTTIVNSSGITTTDLTVNSNLVTSNLTVNTSFTSPNLLNIGVNTLSLLTSPNNLTADFTNNSVVVVKPANGATITLTVPSYISPHRMRVLYLLVKSSGVYYINSTTTNATGTIRFPSNYGINPSAANKYDLYSFITNGQDLFCTFAYNYDFNTSGPLV